MSDSARDKIIQAALNLFSNKGYIGATTKNIASVAGVNESTVFRIFGSKENLFKEILSENNQLLKIIDLIKNSDCDTKIDKQLIIIADLYKQMYAKNPDATKILYRCAIAKDEIEFINRIIGENAYKYLADYFNLMQNNNRISLITTPEKAAFYFLSAIHGAFQRDILFNELEGGVDMKTMVDIFLSGVLTKASTK